jgi:hypothetical protein
MGLSSLTFEAGSKLEQIEESAFSDCPQLTQIMIPSAIVALCTNWASGSSLKYVLFESGASLHAMLEAGKVDLSHNCEIRIPACDRDMKFPGYSVDAEPGVNNSFRLVKVEVPDP